MNVHNLSDENWYRICQQYSILHTTIVIPLSIAENHTYQISLPNGSKQVLRLYHSSKKASVTEAIAQYQYYEFIHNYIQKQDFTSLMLNIAEWLRSNYRKIKAYLDFKYHEFYQQLISACYYGLAIEYANIDNLSQAKVYFWKSLKEYTFNPLISWKNYLIKIPLKIYAPHLYKLMGFKLIPVHFLL